MTDCGSCNANIAILPDSITCDGPCQRIFHLKCANVSRALSKQILDSTNLHYFCDACKCFSFRGISSHLTDLKASITKLYDAMTMHSMKTDEFTTTAAKLSDAVAANTATTDKLASTATPSIRSWPENRENAGVVPLKKRPPMTDSTPSSSRSSAYSKANTVVIGTCDSNEDLGSVKAVEPRRMVVISQLHPSTTSDSIITFVNKKLNLNPETNTIRATMLVKKDRDVSQMDFVSCKLNITQEMYSSVMNASIWPTGVTIRDFVNFSRKPERTIGHFLPPIETIVASQGN